MALGISAWAVLTHGWCVRMDLEALGVNEQALIEV